MNPNPRRAVIELSAAEARALAVASQGLAHAAHFGSGKAGTLRALEHLGYVQIDTISVVERAHHHVLWARVPDYSPDLIHELQTGDRQVFEHWSHAAAYLPMRDYRFSLPLKRQFAEGKRHWFRRNPRIRKYVLDRISAEGPLQAKDFESARRAGPWFDWKPAKIALEQLFMQGSLMIRERRGFQKVYDLTERVLPNGVDARFPDDAEQARHLILSALRAHGLQTEREIRYLRKGLERKIQRGLRELCEEGLVTPVRVAGVERDLSYGLTEALASPAPAAEGVRILSPFDNLVIQRRRVRQLFDFDYQVECYLPERKRKYGYYCLPVLWNGRLAARLDAKADREQATLELRSLHVEPSARRESAEFRRALKGALEGFARFTGCKKIAR